MLLPAQSDGDSQDFALTLTIHFLLTVLGHTQPPALPSRVLGVRSIMHSALPPHGFLCPRPTLCQAGQHAGLRHLFGSWWGWGSAERVATRAVPAHPSRRCLSPPFQAAALKPREGLSCFSHRIRARPAAPLPAIPPAGMGSLRSPAAKTP